MPSSKQQLWDAFCASHNVRQGSAPLFESNMGRVVLVNRGLHKLPVLQRSTQMEQLVISEVTKVIDDFTAGSRIFDGLIYMMFWEVQGKVAPLYIGKSEKYGRGGGNLSANIAAIRSNSARFCRWGYNYAYHIGDLSAVVCPGHASAGTNGKPGKYTRWAERLFVPPWPTDAPQLKHDTYFWIEAWRPDAPSIWHEYGRTSLTFLEYLLIGVVSDLFPDILLNEEGVNRA